MTSPAMDGHDDFAKARDEMVRTQIAGRGVGDPAVLAAMRAVRRECFVPARWRAEAYADHPLPIGSGQTISQPYVVAAMTEALALTPSSRVLEIGTGSGYQCAVLAAIAGEVHSVEFFPDLFARARDLFDSLGLRHVHPHRGDGTDGWADAAPYDAIIATCAAPAIPPAWLTQLADGGRLVAPIGPSGAQRLLLLERHGEVFTERFLMDVRFVPLLTAET